MKKLILLGIIIFISGCALTSRYSAFPDTRHATGKRVFIYDPKVNAWAVYNEQGQRVNVGRATGGKLYCPDINRSCKTVIGGFRVIAKGDENCQSGRYPVETNGGAPMPYCMLFHPKGYAIHGTSYVPDRPNSHGCIGVSYSDAEWLSQFLNVGSVVIVRPYE